MTLEDDDDLHDYENDEVDEEAEEEELGSVLPTPVGFDDPYDPNSQAADILGALGSPEDDDDDENVDEDEEDDA